MRSNSTARWRDALAALVLDRAQMKPANALGARWLALAAVLILGAGMVTPVRSEPLDNSELNQHIDKKRRDPAQDPYLRLVQRLDPYAPASDRPRSPDTPDAPPVAAGGYNSNSPTLAGPVPVPIPNESSRRPARVRKGSDDTASPHELPVSGLGESIAFPAGLSAAMIDSPTRVTGAAPTQSALGMRVTAESDPSALKAGTCSSYLPGMSVTGVIAMPSACR
jgi:hypothetical protein